MKGMPLPFDFEGKGVLELFFANNISALSTSSASANPFVLDKWDSSINKGSSSFVGSEPTSVLETIRSPNTPTSTSTLSSSFGGGGGRGGGSCSTDTAGVAAVSGNPSQKCLPSQQDTTSSSNVGAESGSGNLDPQSVPPSVEKPCGLGLEDWDSVLTGTVSSSPSQDQSILRWIMGDVEDPSMGLNRVLQMGDLEFNDAVAGFGVSADQGFELDPVLGQVASRGGNLMPQTNPSSLPSSAFPKHPNNEKMGLVSNPSSAPPNYKLPNSQSPMLSSLPNNLSSISISPDAFQHLQQSSQPQTPFEVSDVKPLIFNPQLLINQHQAQQTQNPAFFLPVSYSQQEQHLLGPRQAKRPNPGNLEPNYPIPKGSFLDSGQELFMGRQQQQHPPLIQGLPHHLQLLPHYLQQRPAAMGMQPRPSGEEMGNFNQPQHQQATIDQLFKAAELVQTGDQVLAQGILARLNHQLSSIGKPFQRAAFYCKETLQLLLHTNNGLNPSTGTLSHSSPFNLIFKIGAYKSFSEVSPLLQFANFTCNQALLEAVEGFDRIHIIDFDIGYGGQWASLMQELGLKSGGAPFLKITAFASPLTHDQLELGLTRENLMHFASEINVGFEFEVVSIDSLNSASWSLPLHLLENEAIAVNLPVASFSNGQLSLPLVLRFVKQLSPKVVVSMDRGCDRTDLPFANHVILALQSYTNLLESLDAVNVNLDTLQKIERFLVQPGIERIVLGRCRSPEKTQHWRTLFLSSGFSPLTFSNFTESQAECVVKRTPVRGFHVEKRQSSLVLCWQRKELISASAWRC